MADAAVSFLLEKIDYFVGREWDLLRSIDDRVDNLRRELKSMTAILKDADARGEQDHQFRDWIQQVQDLAYDIDNVLDTFILHLAKHPHTQWFSRFNTRHLIGNQIQEITTKMEGIKPNKERFNAMVIPSSSSASSSSNSATGNNTTFPRRIAPMYAEDADIVGIEEPKSKLISWALDQKSPTCKVMFVVGMGGSGKTTLVKKVYESVKDKFDCKAWLTVSRSDGKLEMLWSMFNRLSCPMGEPTPQRSSHINEVDLIDKLLNLLRGRRYVIVLDDLWVKDVWESIRYVLLPRSTSSRIIITTRRGDIAYSCSDSSIDVHNLQPLPAEKARELFYKKAFPPSGICPPGLDGRSKSILEKCEGLPLGIVEIGKFLSNKERTEFEWKRLHDGLESELKKEHRLSHIMRVLSISYIDLPYHLKYCFLYLSNFPEVPIKRRTLIRLWIAEGFIRRETGKEPEDIGEEYLKELIDRSLIQTSEWDFDGRPRLCRVHNLMHKIIISKAKDENFSTVFMEMETNLHGEKTRRRLSIQKGGFNMPLEKFPVARALFMFESETPPRYCHKLDIPLSLQLLKVLHLEGASNLDTFPKGITELLLLTYLCLSHTRIKSIPDSLGNLRNLETLDLKQTLVTKLPRKITKLAKLRHLLVYYYDLAGSFDIVKGFELSKNISKLSNLQKLSYVKANRHLISSLGYLTQLRKLGIIDLSEADGPILCHSIQELKNLQSLNVTASHKNEYMKLQEINNPPPLLQRLYLKGRLQRLPDWISKLHDLVRIRLRWSRLTHDPIPILQDLPNLLELQLLDAYIGTQLEFSEGKFQKLKILEFEQLEQLKMVVLESGSMPGLQKLIIRRCNNLKQVPVGIDNLTHLIELTMSEMPQNFVIPLRKSRGGLRHLVHHIQNIHHYHLNIEGHWVREVLS